jgi:hypothetical protein
MYNQPFSSLWIFDRCQEWNNSYVTFMLALVSLMALIWTILRKPGWSSKKRRGLMILAGIGFPLIFLAVFFSEILFGYMVVRCAASERFWPALEPAIALNAKLNHLHHYGLKLPVDEEELKSMFPQDIENISGHLKYSYSYDPTENRYTLLVRPSWYIVALYDSKIGQRKNYQIRQLWDVSFMAQLPYYPPAEPGPWEKLPR